MRPEDLRSFAQRDWARVERAKLAYWTRQYEEHASGPSLRAADGLRAHVLRFAPAAVRAQRALDLEDLLRLKRRIDAANAVMKVLAGRPKDIEDAAALLAGRSDQIGVKECRSTAHAVRRRRH